MSLESKITAHYAAKHTLDITAADHLHIGGAAASRYVLSKLNLTHAMHLLDIGCGVGGPARLAHELYGCRVTGIDLTPEFIAKAQEYNHDTDALTFQIAHAERLDFADASFDAAMMLHTGMNIPNKQDVYAEVARVLKPQSHFLIYDILAQEKAAEMIYPMPWAQNPQTSFLESPDRIQTLLTESGFTINHVENAKDYALSALGKLLQSDEPLNLARRAMMENLHRNIANNACAPFIITAQKS